MIKNQSIHCLWPKSLFEKYPVARSSEAFEGKEAAKMGLKA